MLKEMFREKIEKVAEKVKHVKGKTVSAVTKTKHVGKKVIIVVVACLICAGAIKLAETFRFEKEVVTDQAEVTNITIEHKLQEIGEMATYDYTYTDVTTIKDTRKLFNKVSIPGTANSMKMKYSGMIKVGYEVADITTNIVGNKIKIELPDAQVLDNYINDDDVEFFEVENSVFNPIEPEDGYKYLPEEKQRQLQIAEEEGIYTMAEDNAQKLIIGLLSGYSDDGYEIEFI